MNTSNLKDKITNWMALIILIIEAVNLYFQANAGDINWYQLGMTVVVAVIGWFTGKKADGAVKTPAAVAEVNAK